jgi:D-tyrosyl-tRNA(Tyr) deacylase
MKTVVQRVSYAKCFVEGKLVGAIQTGFMVLVGFTHGDTIEQVRQMARKIFNLRIFDDEAGKMNLSLSDEGGSILSISQFTLYGDARKGNRPSFIESMESVQAEKLYHAFNDILNNKYHIKTEEGIFGAHMKIDFINDGPVTLILEY